MASVVHSLLPGEKEEVVVMLAIKYWYVEEKILNNVVDMELAKLPREEYTQPDLMMRAMQAMVKLMEPGSARRPSYTARGVGGLTETVAQASVRSVTETNSQLPTHAQIKVEKPVFEEAATLYRADLLTAESFRTKSIRSSSSTAANSSTTSLFTNDSSKTDSIGVSSYGAVSLKHSAHSSTDQLAAMKDWHEEGFCRKPPRPFDVQPKKQISGKRKLNDASSSRSSGKVCRPEVTSKARRTIKRCPVKGCDIKTIHPRRHVERIHLPELFQRQPINPTEAKLFLEGLAAAFSLDSLQHLFSVVRANRWYPTTEIALAESNYKDILAMQTLLGEPLNAKISINPPNSVAALFHWRVVACCIGHLPQVKLEELRSKFPLPSVQLHSHTVDAHCHVADLMRCLGSVGFEELLKEFKQFSPSDPHEFILDAVIAVYSFPRTSGYPSSEQRSQFAKLTPPLYGVYGIHPKAASTSTAEDLKQVEGLLKSHTCVALGEVGLDFSQEHHDETWQLDLLKSQLRLVAGRDIAVVLHCRSDRRHSTEAYVKTLKVCQEELSSKAKIHVHSYNGDVRTMRKFIRAFPEASFGLAPLCCTSNAHPEIEEVMQEMPLSRMLLESDAPFQCDDSGISSPWVVSQIAQKVAAVKNTPYNHVMNQAGRNAKRVFRLA